MSNQILFVGPDAVEQLSLAGIAERCLTSKRTASRWIITGKLKPAHTTHNASYYTVSDIVRMRAEALDGIREELKRLTPDELTRLTAGFNAAADKLDAINKKYLR